MYNSIISIKLPIFIWKVYLRNHHPRPSTTIHNQPQLAATTHNYPKPPTTIHNYPQPPTTTHNHLQLSTTTQKTTTTTQKNHPQPPITIHNDPTVIQKSQNLSQAAIWYCTSDVNTETDVGFDSDMKQWYIWMRACVTVCIYFIISTTFSLDWLFVFCQYSK